MYMDAKKRQWFNERTATLLFTVLAVLNFVRIDSSSHSVSDMLRPFFIETAVLALIIFAIYKINGRLQKSHR